MVKITSLQNANAPSTLRQRSLGKSFTGFDIDELKLRFGCYGSVHERNATMQTEFLIIELVMIILGMILCGNGTMIQQCIEEL